MASLTDSPAPATSPKTSNLLGSVFCPPCPSGRVNTAPPGQPGLPWHIYASGVERCAGVPVGAAPAQPGCSLPPAAAADFP